MRLVDLRDIEDLPVVLFETDGDQPLSLPVGAYEEGDQEADTAAVHVLEAAEVQHYGAGAARRGLRVRIHEDVLTEGGALPLYVLDHCYAGAFDVIHSVEVEKDGGGVSAHGFGVGGVDRLVRKCVYLATQIDNRDAFLVPDARLKVLAGHRRVLPALARVLCASGV